MRVQFSIRVTDRAAERRRRSHLVTALLVMLAILVGCGIESPPDDLGRITDFAPLAGKFSPDRPVVVVPDRFWETRESAEEWFFRGYANLVIQVDRPLEAPFEVVLEVADDASEYHFAVLWDGVDLWPEPRRFANGAEHIAIPRENLGPGLHRLMIRRVASLDSAEIRAQRDNGFALIGHKLGDEINALSPEDADRLELVRAFLEGGVTGIGESKLGGWLMEGTGSATATVELEEASVASFDLVALDGGPAQFAVTVDGREHAVRGTSQPQKLAVEMTAGTHSLSFSVNGAADGLYLWGAPHLLPSAGSAFGPVVVITMDTTRWDAMSFHGGPAEATPNIARLASGATVFENAWATSPWTLPSHASIFTGLYPSRHRAGVTRPGLDRSFATLAEIYRKAGYRTAGFAGGEMSASHWGVAQGFEHYRDPEGFQTRGDRLTEVVADFVAVQNDGAFFLFVNYFDPHALYEAPAEFGHRFGVAELRARIEDEPVWSDLIGGDGEAWRMIVNGEAEATPDAIAYMKAAYLAEVAFMDHQIGRLMQLLEEGGLYDRATIVLVADHGEFLGEQGFFSHACRLDPELTRVPLVVKWPGQVEGEVVAALVSHVDLFPTLTRLAGVSASPGDGLSLDASLGSRLTDRNMVLMEEHEMRIHPLFSNMKIAPNVFGFQKSDSQQVVWRGGTTCSRLENGRWVDARCRADWQDSLALIEEVFEPRPDDSEDDVNHGMSEAMRRRLEALGYVR